MRIGRAARAAGVSCALVVGAAAPSAASAANPEGAFDTSFSGDGKIVDALGVTATAYDSVLQPDDKLLVVATFADGVTNQPSVVRLLPSGAPDTTFGGGDGIAPLPVPGTDTGSAIAVQPDGRIVVAGTGIVSGQSGWVARLNANGSVDTTFSGDGLAVVSAAPDATVFTAITVDAEGRIVAGGYRATATTDEAMLARFTGAGALDTGFNSTGIVYDAAQGWARVNAVEPTDDGGVLFTAYTGPDQIEASNIALGHRLATGAKDPNFRGGGTATVSSLERPLDMLIRPDGRILIAGQLGNRANVFGLLADGTYDTTWAGDGWMGPDGSGINAVRLALQPNGRVLVAYDDPSSFVTVSRLRYSDADDTFGSSGSTQISLTVNAQFPAGIQVTSAGRIVVPVAGSTDTDRLGLARLVGDATAPFGATVFPGSSFATSSRSIRWTASDDNSGIKNYDVRYRTASSSASSLSSTYTNWVTNTVATSASLAVAAGKTVCLEARADDNAGNTSTWSRKSCVAFPLDDRSLTRSGSWTSVSQSSSYKGTLSRSTDSGATLKKTGVRYRKLAVVATTCSGCGKVSVYLGSTKLATLDLNSGTTKRKVVFLVDNSATVKSGTVTIKQVSGGKPVLIDGLGVSLY